MRFSLSHLLIAVLAAVLSASACAAGLDHNRFKWRDGAGNLHYSDALPPEAAKLGYDVVNPQGLVVKRVERAKTAAELKDAKAALAKAQVEQNATDASKRSDQQLLTGYPTESDLKRAQQQKQDMLDQQIVAAQISLHSQEQLLADLLNRAAEAERAGKTLSDAQAAALSKARKQVDAQRLTLDHRQAQRDNAGVQFEAETARYRDLKAKLAAPQQPTQ
ncbi:MAG: DUF4124 domain-containing protein [Dokdonella sp.]